MEEAQERGKGAKTREEREKDRSSLFLLRRQARGSPRHEFRTESVRQRRLEVAGLSLSLSESGARVTVAADPKSIFEKVWRSDSERGDRRSGRKGREDRETSGTFGTSVRGRHRAGRKAPTGQISDRRSFSPFSFAGLLFFSSFSPARGILHPRGIQHIDMPEMSFGASSVRNESAS